MLAKAELWGGGEVFWGEVLCHELWPGCGGDHGGIVGGEGEGWEGNWKGMFCGFGGEAAAELGVGGHTAGDEDGAGVEVAGGGEGLLEETANYGVLEAGEKVEGLGLDRAILD